MEATDNKLNELVRQDCETVKMSDIGKNIRTYAIVPKDEGTWFKKPKNPILNAIKNVWPYTTVNKYFNCKRTPSFLIVNIPLDNIKRLAARYEIGWFYYGYENVTDIWRVIDLKKTKGFSANDYKKFEYAEGITNYSGLPDGYWIRGWRCRAEFNIPIAAIDDISTKIQANIDKYFNGDDSIVDWCINHVGMHAYLLRKRLYQFD